MGRIDPIPDYQMPGMTPKASASAREKQSFQGQAEAFYSWYQSIRQPTFPTEGFRGLQYIMQIGEKETATEEEASAANEELKTLMDDIDCGKKTLDQIPYEIERIVDHLTENNPKSRIVMQATQIEIAVNLSQLGTAEDLNEMMESLLQKVNPKMSNIQAEAISHTLQEGFNQQEVDIKELKGKISSLLK
ncbi:MAG: hypothetical protein P0S93_05580, partial [Candidatus Neptunochlamydia sp.]|nr:hypothetical protein [Candidatus Neptunochlamydia sp.]